MLDTLFTTFKPHTIILTPTPHLCVYLQQAYLQDQIHQQRQAWPSYYCMTVNNWYQELWQNYLATTINNNYLLLTKRQELILWAEIISNAAFTNDNLATTRLALEAQAAWTILKTSRCHAHHQDLQLTANSRAFSDWAQEFTLRCQTNNWLDNDSLADFLVTKIITQTLELPKHLILVNFLTINPQLANFLAGCSNAGIIISQQQEINSQHHHQGSKIMLPDATVECQTMLRWAKKISLDNSQSRIAGVVSNLAAQQEQLRQISIEILDTPEHLSIVGEQSLLTAAISQQALQLLSLPSDDIPLAEISILLHSPLLPANHQELAARLSLDRVLRDNYWHSLSWQSLQQLLTQHQCATLAKHLAQYYQLRRQQPQQQDISRWAVIFSTLLTTWGWPGSEQLTAPELQVFKAWQQLLQEMASLTMMLPAITYQQALAYLKTLATATTWQHPRHPGDQNFVIEIIEPQAAASTPFDYLWVTGMADQTWSLTAPANRFIPYTLQQRLKLAAEQLSTRNKMLDNFKAAAKQVIFSGVAQVATSSNFGPLLNTIPLITQATLHLAPLRTQSQQLFASKSLVPIAADQPPEILAPQSLTGGAAILQLQAACPFKAFAKLRLHAKNVAVYASGLTAKHKARILRQVLTGVWQEVQDQRTLNSLSSLELQDKITQHLQNAITITTGRNNPNTVYTKLIQHKLLNILKQWFTLEKTRPFFKVRAQAQLITSKLAGYKITYRIDRIDELADNSQLIINYTTKTQCSLNAWFSDRPEAPHLPLYLVTAPQQVSGIAFGQLHPRRIKLIGLTANNLKIPGLTAFHNNLIATTTNWQAQITLWQTQQLALLTDFVMGKATVTPKKSSTCYNCDLQALCRINTQL